MRTDPPVSDLLVYRYPYHNLAVARLFAALGDPLRGLAAVRRGGPWNVDSMVSSYRREEGHLATLAGDRNGAIRAYRHYLALRPDPDPELRADLERGRGEVARVAGERAPYAGGLPHVI